MRTIRRGVLLMKNQNVIYAMKIDSGLLLGQMEQHQVKSVPVLFLNIGLSQLN